MPPALMQPGPVTSREQCRVKAKAKGKPKGGKVEKMANTLFSYFKDNLKSAGYSTKEFNRAFLAIYISAQNARKNNIKNGIYYECGTPEYEYTPVFETMFYKKNGGSYCYFLELYAGWEHAKEILNNNEPTRAEYEDIAVQGANYLAYMKEYNHYHGI